MKTTNLFSMKNLFIIPFLLGVFFVQQSYGQCQAFFQYTLGNCPTVSFFDGSSSTSGSVIGWVYDFGDGNTSIQQNPSHTYAANGTYMVCLSISTIGGCTSTYCDTININCISTPSCQADFSWTGCPSVSFTDNSTASPGTVTSWLYDFGDGNTSTQQNPVHVYSADGMYLACLTVTTSDGCTSTYCDTINVNCLTPSCQAGFTWTGCPTVSFTDNSAASPGSVTSWLYDFGDGNTSTQQNPVHAYSANGMYLACLTITTSDGCTSTYCDTINVNCLTPSCQAGFTWAGCPTVAFTDNSTASPGAVTSWLYDFGDGNTSTLQNPVHVYTANGMYLACLTVTTANGCTSTYCDTITINCLGGNTCQADFSYSGCPTVSFTDLSTGGTGSIVSWTYSFGDGGTSTMQNPVHVYNANGSYLACLTVVTVDGCTHTTCDTIVINCLGQSGCDAEFSYDMSACPVVTFTNLSTSTVDPIGAYMYDFGTGDMSTDENPTYTYTANGSYVVCLSAVTINGHVCDYCDTVVVNCIMGVEEWTNKQLEVYPNPVQNELTISEEFKSNVDYFIYSVQGKLVQSGRTQKTVEVSELPKGVYMIEVQEEGVRYATRFVKM